MMNSLQVMLFESFVSFRGQIQFVFGTAFRVCLGWVLPGWHLDCAEPVSHKQL